MKKLTLRFMILMAIVQNPITGRTKGKFASAVFSKQFGKNTMRSKALTVRNPNSTGQQTQRSKFNLVLDMCRTFLQTIRTGWANAAMGMSAYNAAFSYNIKNAITGAFPNFEIDPSLVLVARGILTGIQDFNAAAASAHKINLTWTDNSGQGNALATDKLVICFVNADTGFTHQEITSVTRSAGTYSGSVAMGDTGEKCHAFAFFLNDVTNDTCDSSVEANITLL
jgi:hypothetical protein